MPTKQAAAAVGQCELMYTYDRLFSQYHHTVAQMLITASDIQSEERYHNFTVTLNRLLELSCIPIINENDTIATEEIAVGDNDTLAAIVATSAKADLLILLSDIDGLYTSDPKKDEKAELITEVHTVDERIFALGGDTDSEMGTGGMRTKILAASICNKAGCDMVITNGMRPSLLYDIMEGKKVGTRFFAERKKP